MVDESCGNTGLSEKFGVANLKDTLRNWNEWLELNTEVGSALIRAEKYVYQGLSMLLFAICVVSLLICSIVACRAERIRTMWYAG